MHFLDRLFNVNLYLLSLTDDVPLSRWGLTLFWRWLLLWAADCVWVWLSALALDATFIAFSGIGLCFSAMVAAILLIGLVFAGTRLASAEMRNGHLANRDSLNLTQSTILQSLVMGTLYHVRYWLAWLFGICPFFLYIISLWSFLGRFSHGPSLDCIVSPVGNSYCYSNDGISILNLLLVIFWLMSLTMSILGISFLTVLTSIGLTLKTRNMLFSAIATLTLAIPLLLVVLLLILPEGVLFTFTLYESLAGLGIAICLAVAVSPFVAAFGVQKLLFFGRTNQTSTPL